MSDGILKFLHQNEDTYIHGISWLPLLENLEQCWVPWTELPVRAKPVTDRRDVFSCRQITGNLTFPLGWSFAALKPDWSVMVDDWRRGYMGGKKDYMCCSTQECVQQLCHLKKVDLKNLCNAKRFSSVCVQFIASRKCLCVESESLSCTNSKLWQ